MPRSQLIKAYSSKIVAASATPEKIYAVEKLCSSIVIQALATNTDFIYVGDATSQNFALAPGKSVEIHGDNLDHGGSSWLDISTIYIRVAVNGEGVSFMTLDNN